VLPLSFARLKFKVCLEFKVCKGQPFSNWLYMYLKLDSELNSELDSEAHYIVYLDLHPQISVKRVSLAGSLNTICCHYFDICHLMS
jgi:hypothetical protein